MYTAGSVADPDQKMTQKVAGSVSATLTAGTIIAVS
jgi:hypothetical protein